MQKFLPSACVILGLACVWLAKEVIDLSDRLAVVESAQASPRPAPDGAPAAADARPQPVDVRKALEGEVLEREILEKQLRRLEARLRGELNSLDHRLELEKTPLQRLEMRLQEELDSIGRRLAELENPRPKARHLDEARFSK